jgi:hypothetical protein
MSDKTLNECTSVAILEALQYILHSECRRKIRKLRKKERPSISKYVKNPINGEIISIVGCFLLVTGFGKYFLVRERVALCVVIPKFRPASMIPQYARLVGFDKDGPTRHSITCL